MLSLFHCLLLDCWLWSRVRDVSVSLLDGWKTSSTKRFRQWFPRLLQIVLQLFLSHLKLLFRSLDSSIFLPQFCLVWHCHLWPNSIRNVIISEVLYLLFFAGYSNVISPDCRLILRRIKSGEVVLLGELHCLSFKTRSKALDRCVVVEWRNISISPSLAWTWSGRFVAVDVRSLLLLRFFDVKNRLDSSSRWSGFTECRLMWLNGISSVYFMRKP